MRNERVLAEVVRAWVYQELPGDMGVAERAAAMAQNAYEHGATVSQACQQARAFVGSWARHPAHQRDDRDVVSRLAS